jgi:short-subunit dehydrogenase
MSRHAVVVGSSSGIGAGVVRELSARGWSVSALSRRRGNAERFVPCDVTDDAAVEGAVARAAELGGPFDAVVYAAGVAVAGRSVAVPERAARDVFEVNFWGMQRVFRRAYSSLVSQRGTFVGVLSIAGLRAVPFEADYAASKAACARWLECVALEASAEGVRVGYLAPGYVPTGFLERAEWHGMAPPAVSGSGIDVGDVARAVADRVEARRSRAVLGWRENAIALADRIVPGAYDRLLRARVRRAR